MSYILEALRKLEQKRRRSETSQMLYVPPAKAQSTAKRLVLPYLLFAALIANAGLLFWWLHPWRSERPAEPVAASAPLAASAGKTADTLQHTKNDRKTEETESGSPQPNSLKKSEDKPSVGIGGAPVTISSQVVRPSSQDTAGGGKIVEVSELPLSVSQRLPDLTISGHFYDSRPSSRVVTVGGRMLHEGAAAAPGVKLEKITPDGAVFSCEGYRFRKGVF